MKKLTIIITILIITFMAAAELNYLAAIQDARQTEGADGDICQAMQLHGFCNDGDVFRKITFVEKIKAIFP